MRIYFAQLCKLYAFFLVIIIIVTLGAPLENVNITSILKRDTDPECSPDYPGYQYALCFTMGVLSVYCSDSASKNTIVIQQNCDVDDICVEHYRPNGQFPHAACATYAAVRIWNNFNDPRSDACSEDVSFYKPCDKEDLVISVTTYALNGNLLEVDWLNAYIDGAELPSVHGTHNFSYTIQDYNSQSIKFCFNGGSYQKVEAYAVGWYYSKDSKGTFGTTTSCA